ncbi:hypothetical protein AB4Y89_19180 [Terriglobus sp. 2YAB30_2]|uniref:hypothetical protein n=1 Tax=unclassified Terriglobus TaxID=2628988 RepID=UPI003F9E36A4
MHAKSGKLLHETTNVGYPFVDEESPTPASISLSNAEIADRLSALAQLMTIEKANPYKVRAYRRAATVIRGLGESVDEMVRSNEDLRVYSEKSPTMKHLLVDLWEPRAAPSSRRSRPTART